ncbi:MAG TPA: GNAT family N-acetyltransferase [Acidimicrobiales bacterium]|nr:GNAT family N-acetyltransferase [Acidimicrobiales bacterium]
MGVIVSFTEDAAAVLQGTARFLESRPAEHNLILSLLHQRAASGDPGRYWTVRDADTGADVGVVLQSPPTFRATMTPMAPLVAAGAAEAIAVGGFTLPGVDAEAPTAAAFAGRWAEVRRVGAQPVHGMRLQLLETLTLPDEVRGALRPATSPDVALVRKWMAAFAHFVGDPPPPDALVDRRVERGEFALWETDGTVVCAAARTPAFAGTSRIGPVYTPPEHRRHGYAAACVGHLSRQIMDEGFRCVLYTDLGNPTSNSVYRSLGYRTICENVRYEFDGECQT